MVSSSNEPVRADTRGVADQAGVLEEPRDNGVVDEMYRSMRACRHRLRVLNILCFRNTLTYVRPFDCESYSAALSRLICCKGKTLAAAQSTTRATSARKAFSLAAFKITDVHPSQQKALDYEVD